MLHGFAPRPAEANTGIARPTAWSALLLAGLVLSAPLTAQPAPPPGALSCSSCHATRNDNGEQPPSLEDLAAEEIMAAMMAFREGSRAATVMDRIAKGFSEKEIKAISHWISAQQ